MYILLDLEVVLYRETKAHPARRSTDLPVVNPPARGHGGEGTLVNAPWSLSWAPNPYQRAL